MFADIMSMYYFKSKPVLKEIGAFEETTPSVFVVNSPLQAICAMSAITNLHIVDYKFIICLNNDLRDNQMVSLLEAYKINYECVKSTISNKIFSLFRLLFRHDYNYRRLFIGDLRCLKLYLVGLGHINDNSSVVYIDDGLLTVSYLYSNCDVRLNKFFKFLIQLSIRRNIYLFSVR